MATNKQFKGFTPQQQFTLLKKLGYSGPSDQDEMDKFLAASPGAAMQMGKYAEMAQKRISSPKPKLAMAEGGSVPSGGDGMKWDPKYGNNPGATPPRPAVNDTPEPGESPYYATGMTPGEEAVKEGLNTYSTASSDPTAALTAAQEAIGRQNSVINSLTNELSNHAEGSVEYLDIQERINEAQTSLTEAQSQYATAQQTYNQGVSESERALLSGALTDPSSVINQVEVSEVGNQPGGYIDPSRGQVGETDNVQAGSYEATQAQAAETTDAAEYDAQTATGDVTDAVNQVESAQGSLSERIAAAQGDPEQMAQLMLEVQQMEAAQVAAVNPRQLEPGEAVEGSAVDMAAVNAATEIEAAQADPSKKATVQGQLEELMQDFEGGNTPPWAAGAIRQANAALASRGLGASSMAGQAVLQATMEAAVPIASQDAQTNAQFEMQNLNNRQQTVMFAAQQRAEFLGQKFDQDFQARVLNAQKVSEIANMNFTAEQQIALENARLAQSANMENMKASNAKVLADAAAMSQMELTNLNNRQQAQVQNAQNFLQMDLANLSNQQQTNLFQAQSVVNALLSDQAAENAARQFNAASQNQTDQFFADLQTSVSRFNAEQVNSAREFNTSEQNAVNTFNATMQAERDRFNASNSLVIAQANAQWRQNISMAEFDAENQANLVNAQAANNLTSAQLDQLWQRERDIMAFAFTATENAADRDVQLLLGNNQLALQQQQLDSEEQSAWGALAANVLFGGSGGGGLLGGLF